MGVEVSLCQFDGFANADADDDPLEAELMSLLKCLTDKVAIVNDAQVGVALSESLFAQLSRHYAYGSSPNGTRHFEFPTDAVDEGLVAQTMPEVPMMLMPSTTPTLGLKVFCAKSRPPSTLIMTSKGSDVSELK